MMTAAVLAVLLCFCAHAAAQETQEIRYLLEYVAAAQARAGRIGAYARINQDDCGSNLTADDIHEAVRQGIERHGFFEFNREETGGGRAPSPAIFGYANVYRQGDNCVYRLRLSVNAATFFDLPAGTGVVDGPSDLSRNVLGRGPASGVRRTLIEAASNAAYDLAFALAAVNLDEVPEEVTVTFRIPR